MADITIITGNLNVSGTTYIPSGYTNNSFVPFNPATNGGVYTVRYLNTAGQENSAPVGTVTGVRAFFDFARSNEAQLSRHIRTQKWFLRTGASVGGRIQGNNTVQINSTGVLIPVNNPPNFFSQAVLTAYTIDERLNHIEQSGVFALESNEKIVFGTYQPQEKVHISNGNLRIDRTGYVNSLVLQNNYIPSSSSSPGVSGQIITDSNYIYSHNGIKWRRTALAEW
jgi:hypothetical protein